MPRNKDSSPLFGKEVSFAEAYPQIEDITVEVEESVVELGEIPPELMDEPAIYSVTLIGVDSGLERDSVIHCGSGTLVKSGDHYYILTANHCAEPLYACERIGLPIRSGGRPFYIQKLPPIYIGQRITDEWGPDLAFIPINVVDANNINDSSNKTFYNLDRQEAEMLVGSPETEKHLWAVVGSPISESNVEGPIRYEFKRNTYTAAIESTTTRGDYDYFEVRASLVEKQVDNTFLKGVSGGGVWYANLGLDENGSFALTEKPCLEGVAFYRTAPVGEFLRIRCHGRRSIYEQGLTELRAELARRSGQLFLAGG
jgi:hypothetical protein